MKTFEPQDVLSICNDLGDNNWGLRAFGALLESSDLKRHFCNHENAGKYRTGLNLIITLFIDHQEEKLRALMDLAVDHMELKEKNGFKAIELANRETPSEKKRA